MVCCGASSALWNIKSARAPATVTCASACGPATGSPSETWNPRGRSQSSAACRRSRTRSSGARFPPSATGRSNIPACGSSTLNSMLIRSCSSVAYVNHHRGRSGRISSHNFASGENAAAMFARLRSHEARDGAHCRHRYAADGMRRRRSVRGPAEGVPRTQRRTTPPEPEPDVKELVRVGADTLFTGDPSALEVSRPRRIAGRGFDACVKAVVPGAADGQPRPVTVLVTIEHGKLADRHRATAQDRCGRDTYEPVKA